MILMTPVKTFAEENFEHITTREGLDTIDKFHRKMKSIGMPDPDKVTKDFVNDLIFKSNQSEK